MSNNKTTKIMNITLNNLNIEFTRKPSNLGEINTKVCLEDLTAQEQSAIKKLTVINFPTQEYFYKVGGTFMLAALDMQFYIFNIAGKKYLVDSQGYDYPRYMTQITNA